MKWANISRIDTGSWHKVPTPMLAPSTAAMNTNSDNINASMAWCRDNGSNKRFVLTLAMVWMFEDERDAILFSLRGLSQNNC